MEKKKEDLCHRKTGRSHLLSRRYNLQSIQNHRSNGMENPINMSILDGLTSIQSYTSQPSTSKSPSHNPIYSNSTSRSTNSGIGDRKESNERCDSSMHTLFPLPVGHSSLTSFECKKQMNDQPSTEVCPKAAETIDGTRKELKELKQIILSHNNINHCRMQELISLMEVVVQKAHEVHSSNVKLKEQSITPLSTGKSMESHQLSLVTMEQHKMKHLAEKLLTDREEAQKKLKHTLRLVQSPPIYSCDDDSIHSSEIDCNALSFNTSDCDDSFDNMTDHDRDQFPEVYSSTCTDDQVMTRDHPNYVNNHREVVSMYSMCDQPSYGVSDQQVVLNDSSRNKGNKAGKNKVYNDFLAYKNVLQQETKGGSRKGEQQMTDDSQKVISMSDKMSSGRGREERAPKPVPQKRIVGARDGKSQKQKAVCDEPGTKGGKQATMKRVKGKNKPTNDQQIALSKMQTISEDCQEMYYDQQAIYANDLSSQQMMIRDGKQKQRKDVNSSYVNCSHH